LFPLRDTMRDRLIIPWTRPLPGSSGVLVAWIALSLPLFTRGEEAPQYRLGLLPPTPERDAWFAENCPPVEAVRFNTIGLERRHRRADGGLAVQSVQAQPVAFGDEFVTAETPSLPDDSISLDDTEPPPPGASLADNSTLDAFPPIRDQGSLGSCAAFSATYYQMTHNLALVRGWNAKTGGDDFRFSPKWTYNMINWGNDGGSFIDDAMAVMRDHGAATWAEFAYDSDFRAWCLDSQTWRDAIGRRMSQFYMVGDLYTEAGLQLLKDTLDNGYVAGFDSYAPWTYNGWVKAAVQNDPATAEDDAYVGDDICRYVRGQDWGHAMTIVGYNDHIWCDVNENGVVDDGEKGALKIANSWGTGWSEGGFAWFAYDALKNVSGVTGGPSADRVYGFGHGNYAGYCRAYVMTGQASYEPTHLAKFTIRHGARNQVRMHVGKGSASSSTPDTTWTGAGLSGDGGAYAFDGSSTPVSATFVLDATDLAVDPAEDPRCFVVMQDTLSDGTQGTLESFTWIDVAAGTETTLTPGADPENFSPSDGLSDGSTAYAWLDDVSGPSIPAGTLFKFL